MKKRFAAYIFLFSSFLMYYSLDCPLNAKVVIKSLTENALSLLSQARVTKIQQPSDLPADISLLFTDVKYSGEELKICEFGGIGCALANTTVIVNGKLEELVKPYWDLFWHDLEKFNKPLWYVGAPNKAITQELVKVGGKSFLQLRQFLSFYHKKPSSLKKSNMRMSGSIKDYTDILVVNRPMGTAQRKKFLQKYPDVLLVNAYVKRFTGKRNSFLLSQKKELQSFFPRWKAYKKQYSPTLANTIRKELPAPLYIIKPINSLQSNGVIMTKAKKLDYYLRLILQEQKTIKTNQHKSLVYWKRDTNDTFFVQEYVPSKPLIMKGKKYDPTMRLVFFLSHDQGELTVNVVAGYWKIPVKALSDKGTLTEKHITQPFSGDFFTGICVDPHDLAHAKELLTERLPAIYQAMLQKSGQ